MKLIKYDIAKYLIYVYEKIPNSRFETQELKLQKLMYFAQRESYALTGQELFPSDFEGWKHGPVLPEFRFFFEEDYVPYKGESGGLSETDKYIIESVIQNMVSTMPGILEIFLIRNLHGRIVGKG